MITERSIDIVDTGEMAVVHTFPVAIDAADAVPPETGFERKAAAIALPVPDTEPGKLGTRMRVERGGPLQPYGDEYGSPVMTKEGLERETRERAYRPWQLDGCAGGNAHDHWSRAPQLE